MPNQCRFFREGRDDRPRRIRRGGSGQSRLLNRHAATLAGLNTPGGKLNVVWIPMPPRGEGYFGGSYTNVIFANGVLIVPTWPEAPPEVEQRVLEQYERLLPDWKIVPVPSRKVGLHAGGPRCCSMNVLLRQPRRDGLMMGDPGL